MYVQSRHDAALASHDAGGVPSEPSVNLCTLPPIVRVNYRMPCKLGSAHMSAEGVVMYTLQAEFVEQRHASHAYDKDRATL